MATAHGTGIARHRRPFEQVGERLPSVN